MLLALLDRFHPKTILPILRLGLHPNLRHFCRGQSIWEKMPERFSEDCQMKELRSSALQAKSKLGKPGQLADAKPKQFHLNLLISNSYTSPTCPPGGMHHTPGACYVVASRSGPCAYRALAMPQHVMSSSFAPALTTASRVRVMLSARSHNHRAQRPRPKVWNMTSAQACRPPALRHRAGVAELLQRSCRGVYCCLCAVNTQ